MLPLSFLIYDPRGKGDTARSDSVAREHPYIRVIRDFAPRGTSRECLREVQSPFLFAIMMYRPIRELFSALAAELTRGKRSIMLAP